MDRRATSRVAATRCFVATLFLFLLCINPSYADRNGRAGDSGAVAGRDCGRCHNGAALPTATLSGPQSVSVGAVNTYTFEIMGGPGMTAGFGVSTNGGTLSPTMAGTKLLNREVVHSAPTPMTTGAVSYSFNWQAPATSGTYTLYASGSSTDGQNDTAGDGSVNATLTITVTGGINQAPVAVITGPTTGVAGALLTFSGANSSDPEGPIAAYDWNFGDGTAGSGITATKSFAEGTYNVSLTVTDSGGLTNTATLSVTISSATSTPPIAVAGGPYRGAAGTPIRFDGTASSAPGSTIATYAWAFGDGGTATGPTPSYVYSAPGTYTVILTIIDNKSARASSVTVAEISAAAAGDEGAELYEAHCEECHGAGGIGGEDGDVIGASAKDIHEAIIEVDEMNFLAAELTIEHVEAIAAFLDPANVGAELYAAHCEECHGPSGVGGPDGDVVGASKDDIKKAIKNVDEMKFLAAELTKDHIKWIAEFLKVDGEEEDDSISAFANASGKSNHRIARSGSLDLLALTGLTGLLLAAQRVRRRRN